jgi:hypothetical protein
MQVQDPPQHFDVEKTLSTASLRMRSISNPACLLPDLCQQLALPPHRLLLQILRCTAKHCRRWRCRRVLASYGGSATKQAPTARCTDQPAMHRMPGPPCLLSNPAEPPCCHRRICACGACAARPPPPQHLPCACGGGGGRDPRLHLPPAAARSTPAAAAAAAAPAAPAARPPPFRASCTSGTSG